MKYTFLMVMFLSLKASSQIPNDKGLIMGETGGGIITRNGVLTGNIIGKNTLDTLGVIMVVSDTSSVARVVWYNMVEYNYRGYDSDLRWIFGYQVLESGFMIKAYLDEQKKPLKKSLVVWWVK